LYSCPNWPNWRLARCALGLLASSSSLALADNLIMNSRYEDVSDAVSDGIGLTSTIERRQIVRSGLVEAGTSSLSLRLHRLHSCTLSCRFSSIEPPKIETSSMDRLGGEALKSASG